MERRRETEHDSGEHGHHHRERDRDAVDPNLGHAGEQVSADGVDCADERNGEEQPEDARRAAEEDALGEQLPHDLSARRA